MRLSLKHEDHQEFVTKAIHEVEVEVPFTVHHLDHASLLNVSSWNFIFLLNAAWSFLSIKKKPSKFVLTRFFNEGPVFTQLLTTKFEDLSEENGEVGGAETIRCVHER